MRRLRVTLVWTMTLALLGGVDGAVCGQDETETSNAMPVIVTQECAGRSTCLWTPSDPRLPEKLDHDWIGSVEIDGTGDTEGGFSWADVWFNGPEAGWTGYVYAMWGRPTQNFLVLSGTGANEGWQYVASGTDPMPDGDFDWIGTLYEGDLPPYPHPIE
jgi:hypothetical protein